MFRKITIPLEALRPSRYYLGAYVNSMDHVDSKQDTWVWLEKGVMDAGESTVITGKLISHTPSVRGQLKTEPGKDQAEEQ